jgi:hypothetical protein
MSGSENLIDFHVRKLLQGAILEDITIDSEMLTFIFTDLRLHVACNWAITEEKRILFSNSDVAPVSLLKEKLKGETVSDLRIYGKRNSLQIKFKLNSKTTFFWK